MTEHEFLAERFEEHRGHLRAVAYRMLGSLSEAEDAVQEAWLRLARSEADAIGNLGGWLTTVVARVCLDMLRSRTTRGEEPLDIRMPDPLVSESDRIDPEHQALLGDAVGVALLVVLQTLSPAERLAFVLHDMFGVPFEEIAPLVDRTPAAARQLASRARRRVRGRETVPDADLAHQRKVVDAFSTAARGGDLEGLVAVLAPDAVVRSDGGLGPAATEVRGARNVASQAIFYSRFGQVPRPALVNGAAGMVAVADGRPHAVLAFTVVGGRVSELNILSDPDRIARLDLAFWDERDAREDGTGAGEGEPTGEGNATGEG